MPIREALIDQSDAPLRSNISGDRSQAERTWPGFSRQVIAPSPGKHSLIIASSSFHWSARSSACSMRLVPTQPTARSSGAPLRTLCRRWTVSAPSTRHGAIRRAEWRNAGRLVSNRNNDGNER